MSKVNLLVLTAILVLGGCAGKNCSDCMNESVPERCGDPFDPAQEDVFRNSFGDATSVDILLLSGGGSRGSFGAGILSGWPGKRPVWDMVTGISTGSIMATYAYIGPDAYEEMQVVFNGLKSSQISKRRWLFPFVTTMYTLNPLLKTLRKEMGHEVLMQAGEEYEKTGRQLWIGSTNLDTGQFCHWDLGSRAHHYWKVSTNENLQKDEKKKNLNAIAEEYYKRIIASSANPTVFKEVEIDGDTHVDGGVTKPIYIERLDFVSKMVREEDKDLNVYAIVHGRMVLSEKRVGLNVYDIASRSVSILGKANLIADLSEIKTSVDADLGGRSWNLYTGWIPDDVQLDPADKFCKPHMKELYRFGESWIKDERWCPGLPGVSDSPHCQVPAAGKRSSGNSSTRKCPRSDQSGVLH